MLLFCLFSFNKVLLYPSLSSVSQFILVAAVSDVREIVGDAKKKNARLYLRRPLWRCNYRFSILIWFTRADDEQRDSRERNPESWESRDDEMTSKRQHREAGKLRNEFIKFDPAPIKSGSRSASIIARKLWSVIIIGAVFFERVMYRFLENVETKEKISEKLRNYEMVSLNSTRLNKSIIQDARIIALFCGNFNWLHLFILFISKMMHK